MATATVTHTVESLNAQGYNSKLNTYTLTAVARRAGRVLDALSMQQAVADLLLEKVLPAGVNGTDVDKRDFAALLSPERINGAINGDAQDVAFVQDAWSRF